ncbi:hypothetical protein [Massilia sp. DD77]|uniref:hypothetical protein n=1 Tax=Massilia sp. DD77 TaxID=3109349 RepID=UPI002FFF497D
MFAMFEELEKRACAWAVFAALVHSAAWAAYVHHLQSASYEALAQRRGVIEAIRFTQTGVGGQHTRMRTLVLTVRPLDGPHTKAQEISSGGELDQIAAYFHSHHVGDVVPIWVDRDTGRIDDVLPPSAPDFFRLFLILLPTLGLFTALIVLALLAPAIQPARRTR